MKKNKRVTQAEIARRAKVSQSTVSFVLNDRFRDRVPKSTREKVLRVAKEIGYRTNHFARSLVLGTTNSVGLIYEDTFEFLTEDPFCSAIFRGINQELSRRRQNLIFSTINSDQEILPPMMESYLVEGILLLACKNPRLPSVLRDRGIPHIVIDPFYKEVRSPRILIANKKCAESVVDYLVRIGHQKIGMVAPCMASGEVAWSFQERIAGYKDGLKKNNLEFDPELLVLSVYDLSMHNEFPEIKAAKEAARKLLERKQRPTAIFAVNDRVALGVLKAAGEMGLNVPSDLSIIGFDGLPFTETTEPPLSTIDINKAELGRRAVEMLLKLSQGEFFSMLRFDGKLSMRDSTSAAPREAIIQHG